jgi:hypothetical protein
VENLLNDPAVRYALQGGVAPFVAALLVALLLQRVRLAGLALVAAFCTSVYFFADFGFTPLTVTRKIVLLGIAAPLAGILADFALKPTRIAGALLALAGAAATFWVFWPVLAQKPMATAWMFGGAAALAVAFAIGFGLRFLSAEGVRAGAAGLGLGLGVGLASVLAASATYGLFGLALGAGSGAFLLVQMIKGRPAFAGATFTLPAMLLAALTAAAAMILAKLPWYSLLVLALVPIGARLPVPARAPLWLQAMLLSVYAFAIAALACYLAWHSEGGMPA